MFWERARFYDFLGTCPILWFSVHVPDFMVVWARARVSGFLDTCPTFWFSGHGSDFLVFWTRAPFHVKGNIYIFAFGLGFGLLCLKATSDCKLHGFETLHKNYMKQTIGTNLVLMVFNLELLFLRKNNSI